MKENTTHQVIPRKYRPKTFDDLVGQSAISQCFLSMISRGILPHAILLCGTRGVGKTSTARIFAKALLCSHRSASANPCGTCETCKSIESGSYLDVLEIDGASNNGVDAVRELRETAYYLPSQGKHKIYIIDEVHMLSTSAFNALLKILEEPPAHLIFVFATTDPGQLPATILSRVMRFDFHPIKLKALSEHLTFIAKEENRSLTPIAIHKIAALGNGSMRDAQMLLEQVFAYFEADKTIDLPDISELFSLVNTETTLELLGKIGHENTPDMLSLLSKMFQDGYDPYTIALELQRFLRYVLLAHDAPSVLTEELSYAPDQVQALTALTQLPVLQADCLLIMFQSLLKTMQVMRQADHPQWVLEACLIQLSKIRHWMYVREPRPDNPVINKTTPVNDKTPSAIQGQSSVITSQPPVTPNQPSVIPSQPPVILSEPSVILSEAKDPVVTRRDPSPSAQDDAGVGTGKGEGKAARPFPSEMGLLLQDDGASKTDNSVEPSFAQFLLSKDPLLYGLVQSCAVDVREDHIRISKTNNMFTFEKLKDPRNLKRLESLCKGSPFENKKLLLSEEGQAPQDTPQLTPDLKERRERLKNHPVVKILKRELNAEVTKIIENQSIVSEPVNQKES